MSRVWITRAQPGAEATAARVRDLGLEPLVEPLLEVRALPADPVELAGVGAVAFTSANAVRAFAQRSAERVLPVFVVGTATAAAARDAGFTDVRSAEGDVRAVGELIVSQRSALEGAVLHPSAAEPAGDLVGALTEAGIEARRLTLYETVARLPGPTLFEALPGLRFVLVHSPRAARVLAEILARSPAPALTALCLSPAVAAPLAEAGLAVVASAEAPREDELMGLLDGWARSG
ncbi:MAG TPA: uroporphyrinogen-III synthase [Caulobacteraceae bacterium]|jgi:uroporphyrinogen-III synthase